MKKYNNHVTFIVAPITFVISFLMVFFLLVFYAEFQVSAHGINTSVTPNMPSLTQTFTNTTVLAETTPTTFTNTISTPTTQTTLIQITSSPTKILPEDTATSTSIPPIITTEEIVLPEIMPTQDIGLFESIIYTPVLTDFLQAYLPFASLDKTQIPAKTPQKLLFCDNIGNPVAIPDDNSNGITRSISIADNRYISNLDVSIDISHKWVGDIIISIEHRETNQITTLIHQPGVPKTALGCSEDNIKAIFDDDISKDAEHSCSSTAAAISGIYIPYAPLIRYDSSSIQGDWMINVSDNSSGATGNLNNWCIIASLTNYPQTPTPTPTPITLPSKATITGISGENQSLPLDCESRSAVDWARFFGKAIDEIKFFNKLPKSDNPDKGFVGNVYGTWGKIPPNNYGVHAEPVAEVLRSYGLSAYAHRPLSWDTLRYEIANNHPVIVWIIDSISNGIPIYYLPEDGLWTIVAKYEHTVIVTGYTSSTVSYLNGDTIYTKNVDQFLESWSALENMAIITHP